MGHWLIVILSARSLRICKMRTIMILMMILLMMDNLMKGLDRNWILLLRIRKRGGRKRFKLINTKRRIGSLCCWLSNISHSMRRMRLLLRFLFKLLNQPRQKRMQSHKITLHKKERNLLQLLCLRRKRIKEKIFLLWSQSNPKSAKSEKPQK